MNPPGKGEWIMSVMIVGADFLGNIEKNLLDNGLSIVEHLQGRHVADRRTFRIPRAASLIVVFTDYVNHSTAKNVKKQAKIQNVPVVFSKRSWRALEQELQPKGMLKIAGV
jgi:hypothetical protein